jgi:hypothetical protein
MKKIIIIVIVAAMGFSTQSFSQIKNVICNDADTLMSNSIYAGGLSSVNFSTNKLTSTNSYNLRVGAMSTWHVTKWANVKTCGMYGRSDSNDLVINSFSINLHQNRWNIEFGKMATSATEIRPLPVSANGHFETWTESQMPGGAIGAKIGYKAKFGSIKIGVASRENPEYSFHFKTKVKNNEMHLVGVLGGENENNYLTGLTHKTNKLYQVVVFKQQFNQETLINEQIAGYFGNYEISSKVKLNLYLDAGYNLTTEESPRLEVGLIKNFESKIFKGLIAIGYSHEIKAFKVYAFLHI